MQSTSLSISPVESMTQKIAGKRYEPVTFGVQSALVGALCTQIGPWRLPYLSGLSVLVLGTSTAAKVYAVFKMKRLTSAFKKIETASIALNRFQNVVSKQITDLQTTPAKRMSQVMKGVKMHWVQSLKQIQSFKNSANGEEIDRMLACRTEILAAKPKAGQKVKDVVLRTLIALQQAGAVQLLIAKLAKQQNEILDEFDTMERV